MTSTRSRAIGILAALVAAGLGTLLLIAATSATAGGGFGPRCENKEATVNGTVGTNGNDVIVGTSDNDLIDGRGGKDIICGKAGNDEILAGAGDDRVRGGVGREFINGEGGDDKLFGNGGSDSPNNGSKRAGQNGIFVGIVGGPGDDIMGGGNGDDELAGQQGTDEHRGGVGFDGCFDEEPDSTFNSCEFGSGGGKG